MGKWAERPGFHYLRRFLFALMLVAGGKRENLENRIKIGCVLRVSYPHPLHHQRTVEQEIFDFQKVTRVKAII